jgi:hypothetical protein
MRATSTPGCSLGTFGRNMPVTAGAALNELIPGTECGDALTDVLF